MNSFVEQCLHEWRRIGVPEAIASEMASDLDADLRDAAADGVAPEEVLGNGVFDAPSFARSWASARGVVPPAPVTLPRHDGQRGVAAALAACAVLGIGFLVVVIFHPAARMIAIRRTALGGPRPRGGFFLPGGPVFQHSTGIGVGAPFGLVFLGLLVVTMLAGAAWVLWRRA